MADSKELKPKSFRIDDETNEKLNIAKIPQSISKYFIRYLFICDKLFILIIRMSKQ